MGVPARRRRRRPARRRADGRARRAWRRSRGCSTGRSTRPRRCPVPRTRSRSPARSSAARSRLSRHEVARPAAARRRPARSRAAAAVEAADRRTRTGARPSARRPPETRSAPRPTAALEADKHYDVTFDTNCGSFTFRLDQAQSPHAAASFVSLVQHGFFDGTIFHRIVPDFVIQGGDPSQSGSGGPGYSTVDKPPANATYTHGVVAMAKTQRSRPARRAASSSSSRAPTPGCRPTTRSSAR